MIGEDVLFSSLREISAHLRARRISAVDLAEMSLQIGRASCRERV